MNKLNTYMNAQNYIYQTFLLEYSLCYIYQTYLLEFFMLCARYIRRQFIFKVTHDKNIKSMLLREIGRVKCSTRSALTCALSICAGYHHLSF